MDIDPIPISGAASYLHAAGTTRLVPGTSVTFGPPRPGEAISIDALVIQLEGLAMLDFLTRSEIPLLTITTAKELTEGVTLDPYAQRFYEVSGGDDLSAGTLSGLTVRTIDGTETLTSDGRGEVSWQSARYRLADTTTFSAALWDLYPGGDARGFDYGLELRLWDDADTVAPSRVVTLADAGTAADAARGTTLASDESTSGIAFQLGFTATVSAEGPLRIHDDLDDPSVRSIGQPLLQSVRLASDMPSTHAYHSLAELYTASSQFQLMPAGSATPERLLVVLDYVAHLEHDEHIAIELKHPDPGAVDADAFAAEIRVVGTMAYRPMRPDA